MTPEMLMALRDPAGLPSHPIVFLILSVVTFALHIAAVQVMLGAGGLTLWGAFSADAQRRRLAQAMLTTSKIAVSVAIVVGVAPLLFVQVVYDPFWYTSNVLSAWWVIGFIAVLIVGYLAMYVFYGKNHDLAKQPVQGGWWMVLSLAALLLVGFIVHSLTYQMMFPEHWQDWYAPGGVVEPSGKQLHQWSLPRFLFFIALSAPVVGAWLYGVRRYLQGAQEADMAYLTLLQQLGQRLLLQGGAVALVMGVWWMVTLPEKMAWFALSPWSLLAFLALVGAMATPLWLGRRLEQGVSGYLVFPVAVLALVVVGVAREVLRYVTLAGVHGYDALNYRVQMDWYSTVLFFGTFAVLGGTVLAYLLTVAWQAGQTRGVYTPSPAVSRLGTWAIVVLVGWMALYFAAGIFVGVR